MSTLHSEFAHEIIAGPRYTELADVLTGVLLFRLQSEIAAQIPAFREPVRVVVQQQPKNVSAVRGPTPGIVRSEAVAGYSL